MKKIIYSLALVFSLFLVGCSSNQTLEEYYVDNSENPNFLSLDLPVSLLNLDKAVLTPEQKMAVASLNKLNIIAFKKTTENGGAYTLEKANVKQVLKNSDYEELMKVNTSFGKATISFSGETEAIDELIVYVDNDEKGFALVRVLGDNMNPAHFLQLMEAMKGSDFSGEQFKQLGSFFE
jgi:PBP1b-binding outer membrane lipoprotein LpoB